MPHEECYFRVRHAACGWSVLTHSWHLLADDHDRTCDAEQGDEGYDYRVQCIVHNPTDDPSRAELVTL